MERVFVFLIRNDIWIYIICGLGLFWYVSDFFRAQRSLRSAIFGLERERGKQKRNTALFFIVFFAGVMATVLFVNQQIAPNLPQELLKPPTPTPNPLSTPLSRPSPVGTRPTARPIVTPNLAPTVTLAGEGDFDPVPAELPTLTPTIYVPPTPFVDCTTDLNISDPRDGAAVRGNISFYGTADTENFGAYIMETNGPQTNGQWASLLGREITTPVREGFLGNVNLSMWSSGPYLVRLTTLDIENNITGQCVIQVTLSGDS